MGAQFAFLGDLKWVIFKDKTYVAMLSITFMYSASLGYTRATPMKIEMVLLKGKVVSTA